MPVKFYLLPRKTKQGESPIRVSVSIKYARLMTNIGYTVSEEVWANGKVSKAKYKNSKGATALMINERISAIESHFNYYELHLEKDPTLEDLKKELDIALGKTKVKEAPKPREKNIFDHLPINLNKFAKEILDKYAGRTFICFALSSGVPPQVVMNH